MASLLKTFTWQPTLLLILSAKKGTNSSMSVGRSRRGGNGDGQHIQAVIQIGTEIADCHFMTQVPVGSRYNTHITIYIMAAAQPHYPPFLQNPQ